MNSSRYSGIRGRVLAIALLPAVLVSLGLIAYFVYTRIHELDLDLNERAVAIGEYLAPASEYGVLTGNIDTLKPLLVFTEKEEDLARIAIFGPDEDIIISSPGDTGENRVRQEDIVRYRTPIFLTTIDITDGDGHAQGKGEIVGYVEVWLTRRPTILKQKEVLRNGVMLSLAVLLITAVLAVRLGRNVTGPVIEMTDAVNRIAAGDEGVRLDIRAGQELGSMAEGINVMARRIDESRAVLQGRVDEATRELRKTIERLNEANQKAEAANRAKTLFIANMSHEIRTPLNAIKGFTRLLMNEAGSSEYLELIHNASESLQHIVNDIIDLSRIEAGRLTLDPVETDIHELVEDCVNMLSFTAHEKGIDLDYLVYDDVPRYLVIDGIRLRQVITNLLGNAIKFTDEGLVELRVMLEEMRNEQCRIKIEIKDTGIGISRDDLKKLFNVFTQADSSITRQYGGSGLGLSICKSIVELMGGEIRVDSEPAKGTTVSVGFPAGYRLEDLVMENDEPPFDVIGIYAKRPMTRSRLMQTIDGMARGYEIDQTLDQALASRIHETSDNVVKIICLDIREYKTVNLYQLCKSAQGRNRMLVLLPGLYRKPTGNRCCRIESLFSSSSAIRHALLGMLHDEAGDRPAATRFHGIEALVVDDNPANSVLARALLEGLHLRVHLAADGEGAIELADKTRPDIIFMDVHMPGMSGMEAASAIRQRHAGACPAIVALTADAMIDQARVAREGVFDAVLQKPVSEDGFIRILDRLLLRPEAAGDHGDEPESRRQDHPLDADHPDRADFHAEDLLNRCKQDRQLAANILGLGMTQLEELSRELVSVDPADLEELARTAHAIKGTCSYCAFPAAQERAAHLEIAARGNHVADIPELKDALQTALKELTERKASILERITGPA